jgi:hypothetical protein
MPVEPSIVIITAMGEKKEQYGGEQMTGPNSARPYSRTRRCRPQQIEPHVGGETLEKAPGQGRPLLSTWHLALGRRGNSGMSWGPGVAEGGETGELGVGID